MLIARKPRLGHKLMVLLVILVLLSASGCGTLGGSTQSTTTGGQVTGSGEQQKEPVKIGAIIPMSGVFTTLGENLYNGMNMYFDEIGWQAGGRKIQLLKEDEENDPQIGLRKARKLVEQDKVDILTGVANSSIALAIRDYVDQTKVPMLIAHAGAIDLTRSKRSDYLYRVSFSNEQVNYPMGKWIYDNLAKKVVVIGSNYAAGKEHINGFKKTFSAAGGQIVTEIWPPLGTNDFGSYIQQIKAANPQAVYAFFAGTDAVRFVQQYSEFGLKNTIPLLGSGWLNAEDVRQAQGDAVEGVKGSIYWVLSLDTPENKAFVDKYRKKYGKDPSGEAVEGYDAARVIAEGLNAVKGDTSDKLKVAKAWGQISFTSPRGPIEIDPTTHNIIENMYLAETKKVDGKLQNVVVATFPKVVDPEK
ncbi:MAG: ABC transporter substrate-binding protein [Desulfitobacteriaceae bacterium]